MTPAWGGVVVDVLVALLVCSAGGVLFWALGAPLPWLLGSLSATAAVAVLGGKRFVPTIFRTVSRPVVGVLAGSAFHGDVVASIASWWDAIAVALALSLAVTVLGSVYFRSVGGFSRETAFFSALPAGLAEMSLVGSSLGGNARSIALTHLLRILVVLFAIPTIAQVVHGRPIPLILPLQEGTATAGPGDWALLVACGVAGFGLSRVIRMPAGNMVFPMLLSAVVHGLDLTAAAPPPWLVVTVQVVVGGVVGARFAGLRWREFGTTTAVGAAWAVVVLALAAVTAWAGGHVVGEPFLWMLLALAPAGMMEMTILAYSLGLSVPFVVACHLSRIIFIQTFGPLMFQIVNGSGARKDEEAPPG